MSHDHDLEALAAERLAGAARDAALAHVAGCAECAAELAWLRTEGHLIASRRRERPMERAAMDALWAGIAAQTGAATGARAATATGRRGLAIAFGGGVGAALAIAAAAFLMWRADGDADLGAALAARAAAPSPSLAASAPPAAAPPTRADAAVADAERAYATALAELETEYRGRRGKVSPQVASAMDDGFDRARRELAEARATAGDDLDARLLVLDLYATEVRTLRGSVRRLPR
jgi:hypothetical protein